MKCKPLFARLDVPLQACLAGESWSFRALKMNVLGDPAANLPKACADIGVPEKRFLEDVALLKEWLQQQPHLPEVGDALVVENMLLRSKGSVEVAKQAIDEFFSVRGRFPDLFTGTDPCSEEMLVNRQIRKLCCVKALTRDGHRIIITNLPGTEYADVYEMRNFLKDLLMNLDLLISEDISAGIIFIVNLSAASYQHTAELLKNVDIAQRTAYCVFSANKTRVKAVHVVFPSPAAQTLIKLLMKFAPKKLAKRFHFHPDLESLHKHCPKEALPRDYGGDQKTFLEMAADYDDEITAYRENFVDHERTWLTDESKRPANSVYISANNSFGFDGTFKKLEVD